MNKAQVQENRAHQRRNLSLSLQFSIDGKGLVTDCTTRDISAGGLFIEAEFPHPVGTHVSLMIHVPSFKLQLQADGTVVRSVPDPLEGPPGMAIRFDTGALVGWQLLKNLTEAKSRSSAE